MICHFPFLTYRDDCKRLLGISRIKVSQTDPTHVYKVNESVTDAMKSQMDFIGIVLLYILAIVREV